MKITRTTQTRMKTITTLRMRILSTTTGKSSCQTLINQTSRNATNKTATSKVPINQLIPGQSSFLALQIREPMLITLTDFKCSPKMEHNRIILTVQQAHAKWGLKVRKQDSQAYKESQLQIGFSQALISSTTSFRRSLFWQQATVIKSCFQVEPKLPFSRVKIWPAQITSITSSSYLPSR